MILFAPLNPLFVGSFVIPLYPSSTDHQYISGEKLGALPFCNLVKVFLTNLMRTVGPILYAFVLCPCNIVKEYPSTGDTASLEPFCIVRLALYGQKGRRPTLNAVSVIGIRSTDFVVGQAIVVLLGFLPRPMT